MADDERRAEIDAVARALADYHHDERSFHWAEPAEVAVAALDRVRDARGGDEAPREPSYEAAMAEWQRNAEGWEKCRAELEAARSPQAEDHEAFDPPLSERERDAIEAMRTAVKIVGGEEPVPYDIRGMAAEVVRLRAEVERLSSCDGTVAADAAARDVLLRIGERVMTFGGFQRTPRGEFWVARDDVIRLVDELLAEFPRSEQPEPDALGGLPPSQPKEDQNDERRH